MGISTNPTVTGDYVAALNKGAYDTLTGSLRLAKARMRAGQGNIKIVLIGDSTDCGSMSNGLGTTDTWKGGVAAQLTAKLNASGIPAYFGNMFGDTRVTAPTWSAMDPRVNFGANWTASDFGSPSWGGNVINSSTANAAFTFSPGQQYDTVDVYYIQGPAGYGNFMLYVDGAQVGSTVNATGVYSVKKATFTMPARSAAFQIVRTNDTNQTQIIGFSSYDSKRPGVEVLSAPLYGQTAALFSGSGINFNYCYTASDGMLATLAPDLIILNTSINDWISGTAPATYASTLQTIISAFKTQCDVALRTGNPTSTATTSDALQLGIVSQMRDMAKINGCALIDVHAAMGTYTRAGRNGFNSADDRHPSFAGYGAIADMIQSLIGV